MQDVQLALQNLLLPEYGALNDLFGDVLTKRAKQTENDCFVFSILLINESHELGKLTKDSSRYIRELGLEAAKRKCRAELMGVIGRPRLEFNGRFADFWAEMAAIRVLSNDGFRQFHPVSKNDPDKATNDYRAYREEAKAYVEVKNLHANETVFDVFVREMNLAHEREPNAYNFHLIVEYAFDYRPTGEQERLIGNFFSAIRGRVPPFREKLNLVDGLATIEGKAGVGTTVLVRGVGGDCPEPIDYDWLLSKVRDRAEVALGQIPHGDHQKVLVINVDSTNAMLDLGFVERAKREIAEVFGGDVHPYVLHYRYLV